MKEIKKKNENDLKEMEDNIYEAYNPEKNKLQRNNIFSNIHHYNQLFGNESIENKNRNQL